MERLTTSPGDLDFKNGGKQGERWVFKKNYNSCTLEVLRLINFWFVINIKSKLFQIEVILDNSDL